MYSFDVAPVALPDKVLVHLVLPRCEFVLIQLLSRESAPHLRKIKYIDKGERLHNIQGGRRVLYIVTLSLFINYKAHGAWGMRKLIRHVS